LYLIFLVGGLVLDCATCDARVATMNNDNALRALTAKKWKSQYNAPDISPETINCTGCREAGVKFSHCAQCEIRNCVKSKGFNTCADCDSMETSTIVGNVHQFMPVALENLKSLN